MKKQILQGSLLVALGAACYGLLATYVKLAYKDGFTVAEITVSQFVIGFLGLFLLNLFVKKDSTSNPISNRSINILKLILAGTSLGLTSTFYYLAVQLIPVSIGIVLLMQTVWMGVVLDVLLTKKMPSVGKIAAVILILFGTILATNMLFDVQKINFVGLGWGLLAAVSYTVSVYTSGKIALGMHAFRRTIWMLVGGLIIVLIISFPSILEKFDWQIFVSWGIVLALFGTILPPVLFSIGMPKINLGLGAILSSVEIPVSVLMAYFLLHEQVNLYQWSGIILIMITVIVMNLPRKDKN
jgi:drug/metabolite transporter (DMT)-like permease